MTANDAATHWRIQGTVSHPDDAPIEGAVVDRMIELMTAEAHRLGLRFNVVWGPQGEIDGEEG